MTDLLVSGISRPAWAVAPPATLFLVPALGLGADTGVINFLMIAIGYLGILLAEGLNTTARWTRGLARDSAEGFGEATPGGLAGDGVPGRVRPWSPPSCSASRCRRCRCRGSASAAEVRGGPLQLTDPTLDLRRNLRQSDDREVIEYQTRSPGGVYLRMASLARFNEAGWNSVPIELNSGSTLSEVPGLGRSVATRSTDIRVRDFRSQYLPVPYAPRRYDSPGDWRYDPLSLVVLNADGRADELAGLELHGRECGDHAERGGAGRVGGRHPGRRGDHHRGSRRPAAEPDRPVQARSWRSAETPAAKAAAIQDFLRDGDYTYSVEPQPGMGYQALENFLLEDRQGYCEQFASAMAMMARVAGIPSRVAIGFLPGEQVGDSWEVSRQGHARLAGAVLLDLGLGAVRADPQRPDRRGPAVERAAAGGPDRRPQRGALGEHVGRPVGHRSTRGTPRTRRRSRADETTGAGWVRTLLWSGGGLVLLLILAAPATIRVRRRNQRLSADGAAEEQVESAWAEIRDTVVDHGGAWPDGSPRAIGEEMSSRLDTEEAASMGRVATLVERARYARTFTDTDAAAQLPTVTQEIRHGIAAPVSRVPAAAAVVLPRSLFRSRD